MTDPSARDVAAYLAVEPLGGDHFRWEPERDAGETRGGMFGGLPLALGLRAAGQTVRSGRLPHSLHAYFLRAGDSRQPLEIEVLRDSDGRSFSSRRVVVGQADRTIFTMTASFTVGESGPDEQVREMPAGVPDPESLASGAASGHPASIVEVRNAGSRYGSEFPSRAWGRAAGPLPEDPLLHACVLVHFSDLYTGLPAIPGTSHHGGPSLDHAMWFHRPVQLDDWVFMDHEPVSSSRGRGVYSGSFFDRRGVLVASLVQEMLFTTSRPAPRAGWAPPTSPTPSTAPA